ncbi:MAG: sugar phosphate isomerase/epimerase family protein [Christensenellales bacterium]|jgi:L-ribulose-5-phosphate 3-epimerase
MLVGVRGHDYGRGTPREMAQRIGADGWQCAQIAVQKLITGYNSLDDVDERVIDEIHQEFERANIKTPVLGFYVEPASPDKDIRKHQVELFCKGLTLSKRLGSALVASETGHFLGTEEERRPLFENLVDSVLRFAEHAEKVDATIALEGVTVHTLGSIDLICELIGRVDSKRLQLIIDPVNLLRPEIVDNQPEYWQRAFDLWGERIQAFHVKDVKFVEGRFENCILGEGVVDFDYIFGWMKKNKPNIPLLREDLKPQNAEVEFSFMKKYADAMK